MIGSREVRVGCEFAFQVPVPVAGIVQVEPRTGPGQQLLEATMTTAPTIGRTAYTDAYGNPCSRVLLPAGPFALRYDARFAVPDTVDDVDLDAPQVPVDQLPDEVLTYLMPSRFCVSDVLAGVAYERFGHLPAGYRRVQAVMDEVHGALAFGYGNSTPTTTAAEAWEAGKGVCRDYAHVAISFCRALNVPARYVFGYLPDIDVPPVPDVMDFAAWCEVWLGHRWWTFDPRNNQARTGRVLIGRGRDAVDVAMVTTYGAAQLDRMTVWADEVPS